MSRLLSGTWEAANKLQPHLSCSLYSIPFPFRHTGSFWARIRLSDLWEPVACPSYETSVNNSCAHSSTCYLKLQTRDSHPPHTHTEFHFKPGMHLPSAPVPILTGNLIALPPQTWLGSKVDWTQSGSLLRDWKSFSLTFPIAWKHSHIWVQISHYLDSGLRSLRPWAFGDRKPHEDDSALHVSTIVPLQRRTTSMNKNG